MNRMNRTPVVALDRTIGRDILHLDRGPDWMHDPSRNCAPEKLIGNPDLFFSEDRTDQTEAKKRCHKCPFKVECDTWATQNGEKWNVWGGKVRTNDRRTPAARKKQRLQRAAKKQLAGDPQLAADIERYGDEMRWLTSRHRTNLQIAKALRIEQGRVAAMREYLENTASA